MRRSAPLLAAALLCGSTPSARAIPLPEVMVEAGKTFSVESAKSGVFDQGGFSSALSLLWPVDKYLRMGASGFADDLGSLKTELFDHTQNPPASLGVFDLAHANAYGIAWRMEVIGPRFRRLETFARGDWGAYWYRTDQQGDPITESEKVGWSLGGGVMLPVRDNHAFGVTVAYDRVFSDFTPHFMSANFAWHWRPGVHPKDTGAKQGH